MDAPHKQRKAAEEVVDGVFKCEAKADSQTAHGGDETLAVDAHHLDANHGVKEPCQHAAQRDVERNGAGGVVLLVNLLQSCLYHENGPYDDECQRHQQQYAGNGDLKGAGGFHQICHQIVAENVLCPAAHAEHLGCPEKTARKRHNRKEREHQLLHGGI